MPRNPSDPATARRTAHRIQLTAALLLVCREIRGMQTSAEARAACGDVARELRVMGARWKRRRPAKH